MVCVMSKMGRPIELQGQWGELAYAVGGVAELAEKLGVSPRTIQRAAKKEEYGGPLAIAARALAVNYHVRWR